MADAKVDVVDFLKSQHEEAKSLMHRVQSTSGSDQKDAFQCLVRLLAVHETAEELVVHPLARRANNGESVVRARLDEESEAKEVLAALEKMPVGSPDFNSEFQSFAKSAVEHAQHEENEEFPLLRSVEDEGARKRITAVVELAEKTAPRHPHPHGPESAIGNLVMGSFAAVADRVRDALAKV